jgi:signal transduction histidine kinase/ActR/RegA family two-component response regulator
MGRSTFGRVPRWLSAAAVGLAACAILLAPVVFFGGFALRASLTNLNERTDEDRQDTALLAAGLLARGMAARADVLRFVASRDDLTDAVVRSDTARLTDLLAPLLAGRPDVATVGALDSTGRLVARVPVDPTVLGQPLGDRDYFGGAMRSDTVFIGDVVTSRLEPNLVVVPIAMAVRQGTVPRGVLALTIRPALLISDLQSVLDAPGREVVVADRSGATIASTRTREALTKTGLPVGPDHGTATLDGKPIAFVAAPVAGTAWTLYVLDDPALIYKTQNDLVREIGVPLAWALLGAGTLAGLLAVVWLFLMRSRDRLAIANARLVTVNEEVQAATRAKSDFLANMSHELRTPLNAVLGFSDVLSEQLHGTLTDRQTRYLSNIRVAGEHLLELINDVLDLAKVEAGRLVLRPEPVSVASLVDPVIASAAQLAQAKDVRFEAPSVPTGIVLVDPGRMRQVLLNLISNAVKFTPAGGTVTLRVGLDGHVLRFEVEDTGIGIPSDKQDRVFGVFERLHEGRSDASGTGLGLAITKRLVELQHGTIDFESREGRGTRFWLSLEDVVIDAPIGPRVLIVEDDHADAELLAELAREVGMRVELSPTAATALASIERSVPTAVILDLRLPDRRGDDVLHLMKSDPRTARVPVLVVTVEDDDGRARILGADDHMTKPIDRDRVRHWLRRVAAGGVAHARAAG